MVGIRGQKIPKFDYNNPKKYLHDIDKYLTKKRCPNQNKLLEIERILEDKIQQWYESKNSTIRDYNRFKVAFLDKYYPTPSRLAFRDKWVNQKYNNNISFQEYFYTQQDQSKYIEPPMTVDEINCIIIKQMPQFIQNSFAASIDYNNTDQITTALIRLDLNRNIQTNKKRQETKNIRQINIIEDINHDIEQNDTLDQDNPEPEENHQQYQINTMNLLNNNYQNNFRDFIDELEDEINGPFHNDNDQSQLDHKNTCARIKVKINSRTLNA
ncbi:hypothetical protein HCN44_008835 [Aphidius gifuensis]|uniref:Uncharacterized protein n=1 Tax=Aphidius gifuensis TaxID=684658 RepID=A0A834Y4I4_APHGI|nr:hypothetical protein HCN44_008835 [Aphidius gifuensis]